MESTQTPNVAGFTVVNMRIPSEDADRAMDSIVELFEREGIVVSFLEKKLESEGNRTYSFEEVFPDFHPGKALLGLRAREGLTQKEMAAAIGVSQARLSEYERGKRNISVDMAKKIAAIYGVSYKSLL
jgi:DNA-binding XRE family transcriptional regulator